MLLTKNDLVTIAGGLLQHGDLSGNTPFRLEATASAGYTDYGNTPSNLLNFGLPYCGLTMAAIRDEFIATHIPDWGTMSDPDKKFLIQCWVWPSGTPVPELDALYTAAERDAFRDSMSAAMEVEGMTIQTSPGGKVFQRIVDDDAAMSATEVTTYSTTPVPSMRIIGGAICKTLTAQATIAVGDICAVDTANAQSCVLTSGTAEERWCGVAVTAATTGNPVWLAMLGEATVNCATAAIAIGDFLDPSPTAGEAHPHPIPTSSVFGIALTSKGTGAGTVQVMLTGKENF